MNDLLNTKLWEEHEGPEKSVWIFYGWRNKTNEKGFWHWYITGKWLIGLGWWKQPGTNIYVSFSMHLQQYKPVDARDHVCFSFLQKSSSTTPNTLVWHNKQAKGLVLACFITIKCNVFSVILTESAIFIVQTWNIKYFS